MPTLRPFRDYDEKDVINLFSFSGTLPATAGTLVKTTGNSGFVATDEQLEFLSSVGQSYNNTVSIRYGAYAKVATAGAGETPIGMMLMDVRETDENGEQLKFNPQKAAEMGVVLSGQAVPIVTRGIFLYSGTLLASQTPVAQSALYCGPSGELTTGYVRGIIATTTPSGTATGVSGITSPQVGFALGTKDSKNCVLIKLDI